MRHRPIYTNMSRQQRRRFRLAKGAHLQPNVGRDATAPPKTHWHGSCVLLTQIELASMTAS